MANQEVASSDSIYKSNGGHGISILRHDAAAIRHAFPLFDRHADDGQRGGRLPTSPLSI